MKNLPWPWVIKKKWKLNVAIFAITSFQFYFKDGWYTSMETVNMFCCIQLLLIFGHLFWFWLISPLVVLYQWSPWWWPNLRVEQRWLRETNNILKVVSSIHTGMRAHPNTTNSSIETSQFMQKKLWIFFSCDSSNVGMSVSRSVLIDW